MIQLIYFFFIYILSVRFETATIERKNLRQVSQVTCFESLKGSRNKFEVYVLVCALHNMCKGALRECI